MSGSNLRINGEQIAVMSNKDAREVLLNTLYKALHKDEAVYLALSTLDSGDGVRTSEIARCLNMDRSNCTKALERLLDDKRIRIAGTTSETENEKGRPSRLWKVK
jgi:predicted transcriptional regulator